MRRLLTKIVCTATTVAIILSLFVACGERYDFENTSNVYFYITGYDDGLPNAKMAGSLAGYRASSEGYELDGVSPTFYFGTMYGDKEYDKQYGRNVSYVELYFENRENEYFIKKVEDYSADGKYDIALLKRTERIGEVKYEHSEVITVPRELLVGESGRVKFRVDAKYEDYDETETIAWVNMYYKIANGRVKIYNETKL